MTFAICRQSLRVTRARLQPFCRREFDKNILVVQHHQAIWGHGRVHEVSDTSPQDSIGNVTAKGQVSTRASNEACISVLGVFAYLKCLSRHRGWPNIPALCQAGWAGYKPEIGASTIPPYFQSSAAFTVVPSSGRGNRAAQEKNFPTPDNPRAVFRPVCDAEIVSLDPW